MQATAKGVAVFAAALGLGLAATPATAAAQPDRIDTVIRVHNLKTGAEKTTRFSTTVAKPGAAQPMGTSSSGGGAIPGAPSNSGKGYVDVQTTYYQGGSVKLFTYHERVTWLWGFGVVANPYTGYPNPPIVETYVTNLNPQVEDKGEASTPPDYFYTYASNWSACNGCTGASGKSGFVAERHRHLQYTVPVQGSNIQIYPWVLIRVHWEGTYTWKGYTG